MSWGGGEPPWLSEYSGIPPWLSEWSTAAAGTSTHTSVGGSTTTGSSPTSTLTSAPGTSPTASLRPRILVDSPSPLISYSPANLWEPAANSNTTRTAASSQAQTAALTGFAGLGGKLSFEFEGTGVWVYGGKNNTHGYYNVSLDAASPQTFSGYSSSAVSEQALFTAPTLSNSKHTLSISNAGPLTSNGTNLVYFDMDYIVFEADLAAPSSAASSQTTIETTYTPDGGWSYLPSESQWPESTFTDLSGATLINRITATPNATATFNFTLPTTAGGGAIGLYGSVDPSHGNYSISFYQITPNQTTIIQGNQYSAYYAATVAHEQLLFYQGSLLPGNSYSLVFTNVVIPPSPGYVGLEYVKTWSTGAATVAGVPSGGPNPSKSSSSNVGAIVGGVIGGIAVLLFAVLLFLFLRRRRQRAEWARDHVTPITAASAAPAGGRLGEDAALAFAAATALEEKSGINTDSSADGDESSDVAGELRNRGRPQRSRQDSASTSVLDIRPGAVPPALPNFPPSTASGQRSLGGLPLRLANPTRNASSEYVDSVVEASPLSGYPGTSPGGLTGTPYASSLDITGGGSSFVRDERRKATYDPSERSQPVPDVPPLPRLLPETQPASAVDSSSIISPMSAGAASALSHGPSPLSATSAPGHSLDHSAAPIPPHLITSMTSPSSGSAPASSAATPSVVRYSRDWGLLQSSTPPPEELVLPPEYENARQPWESRRDA